MTTTSHDEPSSASAYDDPLASISGLSGNTAPDAPAGAVAHFRSLENLYASAPINTLFASSLEIPEGGRALIRFSIDARMHHAAGAAHGTIYFKMLDDAAFYAANSLVSDRFLLTTGFNLNFTRPVIGGQVIAEGRWISGRKRVFVAEASLVDATGEVIGRGTGTFMRSRIGLAGLPGYALPGDKAR